MRSLCLLLVLLSVCAAKAHADRDIVYSARYYAPPGSYRTSYFHIYRINPDGTGKTQLTFSTTGEFDPRWSPDGKQITFIANPENSDLSVLCRMDANGRHQRVLRTLGEHEYLPEPLTPGYRLEDTDPGAMYTVSHTLVTLKTGRRLLLTVPLHFSGGADTLLPVPGSDLVYAVNIHNSTVGSDYLFYRLKPATGKFRYLTEGQFLAWAPNGSRFCVAPGKHTTPYEKRKVPYSVQDYGQTIARYRLVWSAPLYVRSASGGKMRQLTPRLSYVDGADWRKAK